MAGAGYDIGFSAAQASTQTFASPYVSNVVFSGSTLTGGGATIQQRDSADATATSKSPGAVNSTGNSADRPFEALPGLPSASKSSSGGGNTLLIAGAAVLALILFLKE